MKEESSNILPQEGGKLFPTPEKNDAQEAKAKSDPVDSHRKDLDAILQDMLGAEDQPVEDDALSNAHSDMSSLLPFGNVIPSDCESMTDLNSFSRTNSEIDLEVGFGSSTNLVADCRPNEVILTPSTSNSAHIRLKSRRASLRNIGDASVSSNESNSLSSILDSIGWSKINSKTHHSRGLNKRDGILDKFFASKSTSHTGDDQLHSPSSHHDRQNQMEVAKYRAIMLFMISLTLLSIGYNLTQEDSKSLLVAPTEPPARNDYFTGLTEMANYMEKGHNVPTGDNRPDFAQQMDMLTPRDEKGKMVVEKVPLPPQAYFMSEITGGFKPKKETPLFWIIPKSGGGAYRKVISTCYSLTIASDYGAAIASDENKELQVIDEGQFKYINVETFSKQGISRSKDMGLIASNLASIVVSPLIQEALTLFDEQHPAQAFTILRHPIQRAASVYMMLKDENKLPLNSRGENIGLEAYARSQFVENNYLTRYLSGKVEGSVNEDNLKVAKEMLKSFIIGLADNLEESIQRFEEYFSFEGASCREDVLKTRGFKKDIVKEGSLAWNLLQHQNKYDLKLYVYAQELYTKQGLKIFRVRP